MLKVYQRLSQTDNKLIDDVVVLRHDQREKARVLSQTRSGQAIGIFLERGRTMLVGELLQTQCGKTIRVEAALEPVMTATTQDWRLFSRACYHLGNRHVKIQIEDLTLHHTPDHILEEMLIGLGLSVKHGLATFVPESGAYSHHHTANSTPVHTHDQADARPAVQHHEVAEV
jgi:urease accessory protein